MFILELELRLVWRRRDSAALRTSIYHLLYIGQG
jgi:hypothetical protein